MFLLWHPSLTAINLSYTCPILETSATALCGTTGIVIKYTLRVLEFHQTNLKPLELMIYCIEWFIRSICQEASTKKRGRREVEKGTWRIPNLGTENEGWGCVICNSNFYSHVWKEANKIGKWWEYLPLHQNDKSMKDWNFLAHLGHRHVLE